MPGNDMITTREAAEKWGITHEYVTKLIRTGRIPNVQVVTAPLRHYLVPADLDFPGGLLPTKRQQEAGTPATAPPKAQPPPAAPRVQASPKPPPRAPAASAPRKSAFGPRK